MSVEGQIFKGETDACTKGCLGEREMWFDNHQKKFLEPKQKRVRERIGDQHWTGTPAVQVMKKCIDVKEVIKKPTAVEQNKTIKVEFQKNL